MTIKEVLTENTHVQEVWINEQNEYYFSNPNRLGFEKKTRSEILEVKIKSKSKENGITLD
jgi:hypothetical protein